jgi:hypothetical protein
MIVRVNISSKISEKLCLVELFCFDSHNCFLKINYHSIQGLLFDVDVDILRHVLALTRDEC